MKMNTPLSLKIITTGDGSPSLWREDFNETYHSIHGAIQESLHVFIKHGLEYIIHKIFQSLFLSLKLALALD